jgi:Holin of 3TMs, for gene-transfer release
MLPALLAQLGLPLLVNAVGGALRKVDHPTAKAAAEALDTVGAAVTRGEVTPEQMAEANRHIERIAEIDAEVERLALGEINSTMRAEMAAGGWRGGWRPFWGYVTGLAWGLQSLAVVACLVGAVAATIQGKTDAVTALLNGSATLAGALTVQWSVALAVLGIAIKARSDDKAAVLGGPQPLGIVGALAERIRGR